MGVIPTCDLQSERNTKKIKTGVLLIAPIPMSRFALKYIVVQPSNLKLSCAWHRRRPNINDDIRVCARMSVKGPMHVWLPTAQANKLATHPLKSKVQCVCLPAAQANSVSMAMSIFHHPSSEIQRHYKASVIFITAANVHILFRTILLRFILPYTRSYVILLAETWKFKIRFCFSHIELIGETLTTFNKARNFQENCL
jgi:hypothetical protein